MLNLTETVIPVYNLVTCSGGKDFVIHKLDQDDFCAEMMNPHRHDGYNILLLLNGRITKYVDFQKYSLEAPALISMAPEQVHQFVTIEDCRMISISFSKEYLMAEMQSWVACWECMFGHVVMDLDEECVQELTMYANLMMEEFKNEKSRKDVVIRNLLNAFIICCARLKNSVVTVMHTDSVQNKLVQQFKYHVDNHFRDKPQVSQYAEMLYVTPGHLNDVIKTTVGKTAKQIIDEKRISEAKRLLFWGNHSIKEIAWQLSFEDDAYFNRFFKKHTGHTPLLFQRMIREKYN